MPKTLILDSTQISQYLTCPEMWRLHNIENLELNGYKKEAMDMGSYGHRMLETYYKHTATGINTDEALKIALDLEQPEKELNSENIKTVRRIMAFYVQRYGDCDFQMSSPDSVEVGFSYPLVDDNERLYILEGKMDGHQFMPSVGTYDSNRMFIDHKFQLRAHQLYGKRIQFRNYALATDSLFGMINYIRFHKNVQDETFVREIIPFSRLELQSWKQKLIGIFDKVFESIDSDIFNKNYAACEGFYGRPCQYTKICEQDNPMLIGNIKQFQYHTIEKWRPW